MTSQTGQQVITIHIVQYLKNLRQPDNAIWSFDRIKNEKHFS